MKFEEAAQTSQSPLRRLYRKLSPRRKENEIHRPSSTGDSNDSTRCCRRNGFQLVFDYFDENGDGKISAEELQSCVRMIGGELSLDEAKTAINSADLNADGLLDFEEFRKLMEGGNLEDEKKIELMEAFKMYSMEGSECITPASLKRMLSRLGESKSINDCKAMIGAFDLNNDGVLSFDEFSLMMH